MAWPTLVTLDLPGLALEPDFGIDAGLETVFLWTALIAELLSAFV